MHANGRTVGIIGMGRIGKAIARRCHFGFAMKVIFHNRSAPAPAPALALGPGLPATQLPLAQVPQADIVVMAVPGSKATHPLMGKAEFARMRPGAVREGMGAMALDNLFAHLDGRLLPNLV